MLSPLSSDESPSERFMKGVILALVGLMVAGTLGLIVDLEVQDYRQAHALDHTLAALATATHQSPMEAKKTLASYRDELTAAAQVDVRATEGGTEIRWHDMGSAGCDELAELLQGQPQLSRQMRVEQNGFDVNEGTEVALRCYDARHNITTSQVSFFPR